MRMAIIHLLSLLFFVQVQPASPFDENKLPTPYPAVFRIRFSTNLTLSSAAEGARPVDGNLSYDWSLQAQRIDHGGGAYECTHFYSTTEPCSLVFNQRGMYRIVEDDCCLDLPGMGPPPPDWGIHANGTFNGLIYDHVSELYAFQWTFDNLHRSVQGTMNSAFHSMREVAMGELTGRPLTFTFPGKAEGRQDYHFHTESLVVGPLKEPSIFDVPSGCVDRTCAEDIAHDARIE